MSSILQKRNASIKLSKSGNPFVQAKALIHSGEYQRAYNLLLTEDDPKAEAWMKKLEPLLKKQQAKASSSKWIKWAAVLAVILVLAVGGFIVFNSVLNQKFAASVDSKIATATFDPNAEEATKFCVQTLGFALSNCVKETSCEIKGYSLTSEDTSASIRVSIKDAYLANCYGPAVYNMYAIDSKYNSTAVVESDGTNNYTVSLYSRDGKLIAQAQKKAKDSWEAFQMAEPELLAVK